MIKLIPPTFHLTNKGFRPITPEEYVVELKRRREECPDAVNSIKIWVMEWGEQ